MRDVIAGINYPWTVVNGRPNYGCDFGRNIWNSHTGVSTHVEEVQADLTAMAGLEPPFGRETLAIDELRALVGDVSARIHARSSALVTLGGGRVRFASEWDHPAYGLDFIQVHSYPDVRYQDRDVSVFGRTAASFGLSKPLLIGEHPASPRQHPPDHLPPAYWLEDYQALVRDGGYLGAWPWSFKGVDAFGAVNSER